MAGQSLCITATARGSQSYSAAIPRHATDLLSLREAAICSSLNAHPQKAIDFRSKVGIGTWAHTSPHDLGKIAVAARAKSLVATHFGHFDTTNPVLKKHLASTCRSISWGPASRMRSERYSSNLQGTFAYRV
jgi:hypothetical protein